MYLNRKNLVEKTGLSKSTIYTLIKEKRFPKPYRLSKGRVGWLVEEVEAWSRELDHSF